MEETKWASNCLKKEKLIFRNLSGKIENISVKNQEWNLFYYVHKFYTKFCEVYVCGKLMNAIFNT